MNSCRKKYYIFSKINLSIYLAGIRRIQRVSDVNAMGYTAPQQNAYAPNTFASEVAGAAPAPAPAAYNYNDQINMNQNNAFAPNYSNAPTTNPYYDPYNNANPPPQYGQQPQVPPQSASPGPAIFNPTAAANPPNAFPNQFSVLQQPMVQDMALQYGQRLADQGKQLVESQFEKYVPVTRLKYYFAVDNNYVVRKLILLLFPFTHRVSYALKCIFQFYFNFFFFKKKNSLYYYLRRIGH